MGRKRKTDQLQARRWASLGRQLGFAWGVFNHRVMENVRAAGFSDVRHGHSTLTRNMSLEGSQITALAKRAGISKQAMGRLVNDMAELGYVTWRADPKDGRAKIVVYTKRGLALAEAIVTAAEEVELEFRAAIGERRCAQLKRTLDALLGEVFPEQPRFWRDT